MATDHLGADLRRWVEQKVKSGQYPSEEAVLAAALAALKGQEANPTLEDFVDLEFEAFCARESDDSVSLEQVRDATSAIPGSMAEVINEEERADRF
jgi:Arc/MetJ-type ribon-helix-helix transcriptional regulator